MIAKERGQRRSFLNRCSNQSSPAAQRSPPTARRSASARVGFNAATKAAQCRLQISEAP
jgi:hypothetical protein